MTLRIFDKYGIARGSLKIHEGGEEISIRFSGNNPIQSEVRKLLRNFLKENDLFLVNGRFSLKKHKINTIDKSRVINGFEVYYKHINPRTQKFEFVLIK